MATKQRRTTVWHVLLLLAAVAVAVVLLRFGCDRFLHAAYPDTYRETVLAAAEEYDLPPSLIFAVIHTESSFRPDAVSTAGAVGLMQVTEDTLDWAVMRTDGDTSLTVNDLTDPTVNIHTGACVLSLLSDMFENGDTVLAAYNAGMGNVKEWLSDSRYSADGVTLTAIPFQETDRYVAKVRHAQNMYQTLYDLK